MSWPLLHVVFSVFLPFHFLGNVQKFPRFPNASNLLTHTNVARLSNFCFWGVRNYYHRTPISFSRTWTVGRLSIRELTTSFQGLLPSLAQMHTAKTAHARVLASSRIVEINFFNPYGSRLDFISTVPRERQCSSKFCTRIYSFLIYQRSSDQYIHLSPLIYRRRKFLLLALLLHSPTSKQQH